MFRLTQRYNLCYHKTKEKKKSQRDHCDLRTGYVLTVIFIGPSFQKGKEGSYDCALLSTCFEVIAVT